MNHLLLVTNYFLNLGSLDNTRSKTYQYYFVTIIVLYAQFSKTLALLPISCMPFITLSFPKS